MSQRNIFEDVSIEKSEKPIAKPVSVNKGSARKNIVAWLLSLFMLVVVMIIVGGLTRLTDSGLSITEWKPVTGSIPPLSAEDWAVEFEKYQATPEYQLQNTGMEMSEFKVIFWWEWGHRFLGRIVGLVWAVGFLFFFLKKQIPTGWTTRLFTLGILGGLQAVIGWWMVSSGLTGRMVDVASYRLATHLGLAFVILGLIAWFVFELKKDAPALLQARRRREQSLMTWGGVLIIAVFLQILLGALVAGIDAGRSFPTWPSMAGEFLPSESFDYSPTWTNFFENPALVQFNHRLLGYAVFILGLIAWWSSRKSALANVRHKFSWMMTAMFGQMVLGIVAVLHAAPMSLAITHQVGAIILFVTVIHARFAAAYPEEQKISRG